MGWTAATVAGEARIRGAPAARRSRDVPGSIR